jgi:mRNA interferase MazF
MVVVAMTSNPALTAYSFTLTSFDLEQGALNRPGVVRVDKIYTLAQSLIVRTFGQVDEKTLQRIQQILHKLITE